MKLSETAFLHSEADVYRLRCFAPASKVDLCGHATLAAAHMLWVEGHRAQQQSERFHTRSGVVTANHGGEVTCLDFRAVPAEPVPAPPGLLEALGARALFVGRSEFNYLVQIASAPGRPATRLSRPNRRSLPSSRTRERHWTR